jgi:drug/metabolite transporter (DMT)-like permease
VKPFVLYLVLATLGTVSYHVGQKALPAGVNPMVLLMAMYGVAFLLAAAAAPMFGSVDAGALRAAVTAWPVLMLAVGVVAIEGGFLLAYRSGAPLNWSGAAVNGLSSALLVPIALLAFGESLNWSRACGLAAIVAGLVLLVRE